MKTKGKDNNEKDDEKTDTAHVTATPLGNLGMGRMPLLSQKIGWHEAPHR
jgi:hypothetical protein